MSTEIAVITCHKCGRTIYVYQGPKGPEAFCINCGHVWLVREENFRWGLPICGVPKGAITREV